MDKITAAGRKFDPSAVSGVELARQTAYMIRAHYANSGHSADGKTDAPLYYSSIEGLGGADGQTVAELKELPRKGADKSFRMIAPFNLVPKACRTDVACMMNDFRWDRLEVVVDGTRDDALTLWAQDFVRESERRRTWTLRGTLWTGASRGDWYARVKADRTFQTGARIDLALPEGVYPVFDTWLESEVRAYRMIYKVLAESMPTGPDQQLQQTGVRETHTERIDAERIDVWKDKVQVLTDDAGNRVSGPHGLGRIPMVHGAHRDSGEYFGIPAIDDDTIALIDACNVDASNIHNLTHFVFGTPNLFLFGEADDSRFIWGRRAVHGLPAEARAELLSFEGLPDLLQSLEAKTKALSSQVVQLIIDEIRTSSSQDSGVALAIRLFPFDSYLAQIEQQYTAGIGELVELGLRITGRWPQRGAVEVRLDWGARFPVDIMARLNAAKTQVDLFGPVPELLAELAKREGYPQQLIDAILAHHQERQQTQQMAAQVQALGGGLLAARAAEERRQQRLLQAGAGPAGRDIGGIQP